VQEKYDSVLVISDTHIGLPDEEIYLEDFESFVTFLATSATIQVEAQEGNFQIKTPNAIVLVGDFIDFWDGRLAELPMFSATFARLLTELADIFYLRGNHDYIVPRVESELPTTKRFEICEHKLLEIRGKLFFLIHGHQFMSAFGQSSLKLESYVNPFYTVMETFFSRFTGGNGRYVLALLTVASVVLGLLFWVGQALLTNLPSLVTQSLWLFFGLLLPVGFVTVWRVGQKTLWKFLTMIFGELMNSLRGAARGDTIEYLTSASKPISRWFEKPSEQSEQAKAAEFVVFGHTHIPEGPTRGSSETLHGTTFLNTGSWMRPPSKNRLNLSERARRYTRSFDRLDEYALVVLSALTVAASLGVAIPLLPVLTADLIMLPIEILVVLGKSSYRRLPKAGVRSLAFIGNDATGVFRTILLYWNPAKRTLSTSPQ